MSGAVCPNCGKENAYGGTVVWCECSGWLDEDTLGSRFDLYGALYILCTRYHTGQASRGYRILSRLSQAGYSPGLSVQQHTFESKEMRDIYLTLAARYRHDL